VLTYVSLDDGEESQTWENDFLVGENVGFLKTYEIGCMLINFLVEGTVSRAYCASSFDSWLG
jgi:hypothetical protein